MAPNLQDDFGSPEELGAVLEGDGVLFDSFTTHSSNLNNDTATFEGELNLEAGGSTTYSIELVGAGDNWQVIDFSYDLP